MATLPLLLVGSGVDCFISDSITEHVMSKITWTPKKIASLNGKIVVVTGANSGIGFESARLLAMHGAEVIMACRNEAKGRESLDVIRNECPQANITVMALDLADQQSIKNFVSQFSERHSKLDILLNNAGLMSPPFSRTVDGFEMQFGTNHLGHFTLTGLLLNLLEKAEQPRIVTVSSVAHNFGNIYFDNLDGDKGYFRWAFYCQSKLANLIFARELHRRLRKTGSKIESIAVHPGYSDTNLQSTSGTEFFNRLFAQPQHMGCYPSVFAATSHEAKSGEYYGPNGFLEAAGYPAKARVRKLAKDQKLAKRLWLVSEQLTGVRYL